MGTRQEEAKNYYQLLGVERSASKKEIKEAYKEIALVYHPDSNFFSEIIDAKVSDDNLGFFKEITAAYHTLINDQKRADYDATIAPDLRGWNQEPEQDDLAIKTAVRRTRKNTQTFGTFGVLKEQRPQFKSAFDQPYERVRPVSEIIRRPSLFTRILSLLKMG